MKRFVFVIALACAFSGTALAGEIHTAGVQAPPPIAGEINTPGAQSPSAGDVPSVGAQSPEEYRVIETLMLTILGLVVS